MDGWNVIKDAADIEELLQEYGGFHDSCLVNASWNSGMYVDANNGMHLGEAKDYRLQMLVECPILQKRFDAVGIEHYLLFKVKVEQVEMK